MKVFNKGQIVIPVAIRRALGIEPGDQMAFELDLENRAIVLRSSQPGKPSKLAGSLASYAQERPFPNKKQRQNALRQGHESKTP